MNRSNSIEFDEIELCDLNDLTERLAECVLTCSLLKQLRPLQLEAGFGPNPLFALQAKATWDLQTWIDMRQCAHVN